jgi:hypothetical protein
MIEAIEEVTKTGRTTGKTRGGVTAIEVDGLPIYFPSLGIVEFDGLIEIDGGGASFSEPGDSGSLVTDLAEACCVAMVIGGDGTLTWGTPLRTVLDSLGTVLA